MSALAVLWFFLIFVLIAGYFLLDGFDLGVGVLYRALAKDERERALVRRSIGPVWDGNEVWLLTAGGALFAAFPAAYATTFSGFYLAVMLVLFGLIVRAVSLEFRAHDPQWARAWDVCFTVGSLLPALLLATAFGLSVAAGRWTAAAAVVTAALPSAMPVSMPVVRLPPLVLASPFAFSSSPPPNQPVMVSQIPLPSFASASIAPLMPLEIVLPTPPQSMPEIAVFAASKPENSHAPAVSRTVSTPPLMEVPTSFHGIPAT